MQGPVVLKAFQHVDAGKSLRSLLQWMNSTPEAGRPDGAPWSPRTLRILLLNRTYLGERTHKGGHGEGTWDAIRGLDTPAGRAMFNRVTAKLTDPARRTVRGTEVAHLLTYLALCGECGDHALLRSQPRSDRPLSNLACSVKRDVSMGEPIVDAFVEEAVIAWFSDKTAARAALVPGDEDMAEEMAAAQRLINGYEEQMAEARELAQTLNPATGRPRLSVASLADMEERLQPKIDAERNLIYIRGSVAGPRNGIVLVRKQG